MIVRHVLGISGGKDSAALAIFLKEKYPELPIEYYNTDTGHELDETIQLLERLESVLGDITRLTAPVAVPGDTPFDHFLKVSGGYLPSPQARWCTQKMKLAEFEKFVGDEPTISYVGIRGDEDREGYVSTKTNIQAIFPFRRNIWGVEVVTKVLNNENIDSLTDIYSRLARSSILSKALKIITRPISKDYFYKKKLDALLDLDTKLFNKAMFHFLKTTDYPVGKLDYFPLIENDDIVDKKDVFRILQDSGVGIPAYYTPIKFEVDGKTGTYSRTRSGCYFCFYQQKIEWIWLYEQHPNLFFKSMEFEKEGYTWSQGESLEDLIRPERIRQIKLDAIKRQENLKEKSKNKLLKDMLFDDDDINCANCFI